MALTKGTNSYVTAAEASTYLSDRSGSEAYDLADPDVQSQALVTAARILEQLPWVGYASTAAQVMAWPRTGTYYDSTRGRSITLVADATEAPERVKRAQYELALHIFSNDGITIDTGAVQSLTAGAINLQIIRSAAQMPESVLREIRPLLQGSGGRGITRVN